MKEIVHHDLASSSRRNKELPTAEKLSDRFAYDSKTGRLIWKRMCSPSVRIGTEAGHLCKKDGYRYVKVDGSSYVEHRIIWVMLNGSAPLGQIDHINGVRDDNRIENLRDVTAAVNLQNLRKHRSTNKSTGLLGAYSHHGRIWSSIMVNGKVTFLGNFETAQEAHEAYLAAKRKLHEGCTI